MRMAIAGALLIAGASGVGAQQRGVEFVGTTACEIKSQAPRALTFACVNGLYDGWAARGDGTHWFGYVFCTRRGASKCFDSMLTSIDIPRDVKLAPGAIMKCVQIADLLKCRYGENGWT